jgi:hypothetical protein
MGSEFAEGGFFLGRDSYAFIWYGTSKSQQSQKELNLKLFTTGEIVLGRLQSTCTPFSSCNLAACTFPKFSIVGCPLQ